MDEAQWLTSEDPAAKLYYLRGSPPSQPVRASNRKLRLFATACCRAVWHLLTDPRSRRAVEVAESFADGGATEDELDEAGLFRAPGPLGWIVPRCCWGDAAAGAEEVVEGLTRHGLLPAAAQAHLLREVCGDPWRPVTLGRLTSCNLCFGHTPDVREGCCHVSFRLTPTVLSLAQAAYDERGGVCGRCHGKPRGVHVRDEQGRGRGWKTCPDCHGTGFDGSGHLHADRLAVLSDQLWEAGCDNEELLCHLHGDFVNRAGEKVIGAYRHLPHVRGCWALDLLLGKE